MAPLEVLLLLLLTCLTYHVTSARPDTGNLRDEVRSYIDRHGREVLIRRAPIHKGHLSVEDLERARRCECHCRSRYHRDEWHCCPCTWTQKVCFPGHATVWREDGTTVSMADLRRGERVLTLNPEGRPVGTEVRAFMQRNTTGVGLYLTLTTSRGQILPLSASHLVYTAPDNSSTMAPVFAEKVNVGDYLLVHQSGSTDWVKVTGKGHMAAEGAYTPLTEHGTLLVNDVMASCYASFHHQVAHAVMAPLRWFPALLDPEPEAEGMRWYPRALRTLGRWTLPEGLQNEAHWLWDVAMATKWLAN